MNSSRTTGGYFGLELRKGEEYHKNALGLNTGRNALELILTQRKYQKVYIPYYTCDVILEPFKKLKIDYEFYHIDKKFDPIFDYDAINKNEGFLYTNYFGLKQHKVEQLSKRVGKNLIIDNAQAFFAKPLKGVDTFYSARKFFGVSDGAYLYTDSNVDMDLGQGESYNRFSHLLKRIDCSAEKAYIDFKENENKLIGMPILLMSKLTNSILSSIDYERVKSVRRKNYLFLDKYLKDKNLLTLELSVGVPMAYPFRTNDATLRKRLIDNKIFVPTYWNNVFDWCKINDLESMLASQIIPLPIDQRYNEDDLLKIIEIIR
jgi:hypothetical protein